MCNERMNINVFKCASMNFNHPMLNYTHTQLACRLRAWLAGQRQRLACGMTVRVKP